MDIVVVVGWLVSFRSSCMNWAVKAIRRATYSEAPKTSPLNSYRINLDLGVELVDDLRPLLLRPNRRCHKYRTGQ